jgi:hypothetical protein
LLEIRSTRAYWSAWFYSWLPSDPGRHDPLPGSRRSS